MLGKPPSLTYLINRCSINVANQRLYILPNRIDDRERKARSKARWMNEQWIGRNLTDSANIWHTGADAISVDATTMDSTVADEVMVGPKIADARAAQAEMAVAIVV
jgi:hypothetical protein